MRLLDIQVIYSFISAAEMYGFCHWKSGYAAPHASSALSNSPRHATGQRRISELKRRSHQPSHLDAEEQNCTA